MADFLDELLSKTDLVQIVSKYVSLTKKGNTYWGCCPFHHEKEPSFTVSQDKQLYYCFGCKEAGNAISFIKKIESVDGRDAVRILADAAHMEVPEYRVSDKAADEAFAKKKERLLGLMRVAALHYHENLMSPQGETARKYCEERQITSVINKFGIGYSINGTEMPDYLKSKGYSHTEMKEAGIAEQSANGWYDVFYGRLMIPIINAFNNVIAFGGRTLEKDAKFAKYRNSCQTILFDKSKTIFGINLIKKKKQNVGLDSIIITEGYMDTISLHKAGFDNVVASMGTSLTSEQARMLKNYCNKIYISYDGDGAGQKATLRGLDILESVGLNVRVVPLGGGFDPDDIIKRSGADGYRQLLSKAVTLTAFKINNLAASHDLSQPDGKSKFAVEAIKVIKRLDNPVEQEEYLGQIHKLTGYSMSVLLKQAELTERQSQSENKGAEVGEQEKVKDSLIAAQTFVLAALVNALPYADFNSDIFPYLSDERARKAYSLALERYKQSYSVQSLVSRAQSDEVEYISELINYKFMPGDDRNKFDECVALMQKKSLEQKKEQLISLWESTKDSALLGELATVEKQLKRMKK